MAKGDLELVQEIAMKKAPPGTACPPSPASIPRGKYGYSLLSADEEAALIRVVCKARGARRKNQSLVSAWKQAVELLVLCNLGMVFSIIKSLSPPPDIWEDLTQEGVVGLLKAIKEYDPARGCRFSTYAFFWVRLLVVRAYDKEMGTSARGRRVSALLSREWERLAQEHKRIPTRHEMEKMRKAVSPRIPASPKIISIHGDEEERPLEDRLPSGEDMEQESEQAALRDAIEGMLSTLSPTEAFIIRAKYGIGVYPMKTGEIAATLGISPKMVQYIARLTLKKFRHPRHLRELRAFL